MSDEIRDTAEAVKGIVEAIPVYEDAVQPAARQVSKALETVAKGINVLLAPVAVLVWSYEKIGEYLVPALEERLRNVAAEYRQTPSPSVAGPAIEAMRFTAEDAELRDLYANLLATAMDSRTARAAHPGFVEVIKQLSPDEARILSWLASAEDALAILTLQQTHEPGKPEKGFVNEWRHLSLLSVNANCAHVDLGQNYIDNLSRLGLIVVTYTQSFVDKSLYEPIKKWDPVKTVVDELETLDGFEPQFRYGRLAVTTYGQQFLDACVRDHDVVVASEPDDAQSEAPDPAVS